MNIQIIQFMYTEFVLSNLRLRDIFDMILMDGEKPDVLVTTADNKIYGIRTKKVRHHTMMWGLYSHFTKNHGYTYAKEVWANVHPAKVILMGKERDFIMDIESHNRREFELRNGSDTGNIITAAYIRR